MLGDREVLFIGLERGAYGEEIYVNLKDGSLGGWSAMGLRPETEDTLRTRQRETEPEDVGLDSSNYFDYETFKDDMEEDWLEHHDSQLEYERDGETYYCGFGSGSSFSDYFESNDIKNWSSFEEKFEEYNINETQFYELLAVLEIYKEDKTQGYAEFLEWSKDLPHLPSYTD